MADSEPTPTPPAAPVPPDAAPQPAPAAPDLQRTHPLTVAVKTGRAVLSALGFFLAFVVFGSMGGRGWESFGIAGLIVLAALAFAALTWLSWSRFMYGIVGNDLLINEGILVRKRKTIPLARVQGVDVRADLFNRALGLVELRVQTAGGGDEPEAVIGSVRLAEAEVLRAALLRGHVTAAEAAGTDAANPILGQHPVGRMSDFRGALGGAEIAREEPACEYTLPPKMLVISAITSKQITIILLIVLGAGTQIFEWVGGGELIDEIGQTVGRLTLPALIALIAFLAIVGFALALVVAVAKTWGFSARRVADRIETEAGLLERRMTSVPTRRIQSVSVQETWLRRLLGYQAVYVETAGFGRGEEDKGGISTQALIPLAKRDEIRPLMHGLLPEAEEFPPAQGLPSRARRFYLFAPTLLALLIAVPIVASLAVYFWPGAIAAGGTALVVAAIVAATRYLNWRSAGIGADEEALTVRTGLIGQNHVRLGRNRIQSLHVRQNPFQRRAGLATLNAWSVAGSSKSVHGVAHLPLTDAEAIVEWFHEVIEASTRPA